MSDFNAKWSFSRGEYKESHNGDSRPNPEVQEISLNVRNVLNPDIQIQVAISCHRHIVTVRALTSECPLFSLQTDTPNSGERLSVYTSTCTL